MSSFPSSDRCPNPGYFLLRGIRAWIEHAFKVFWMLLWVMAMAMAWKDQTKGKEM
jgi:hypothetical protein